MGDAKRRNSHPPNVFERFARWMNRLWLVYPRPVRTFYRVNAEIVGVVLLVLVGVAIVALLGQWLMHR